MPDILPPEPSKEGKQEETPPATNGQPDAQGTRSPDGSDIKQVPFDQLPLEEQKRLRAIYDARRRLGNRII